MFGMGTGVTLAVCSPASLGAALGRSFPAAISLHTRAVSPRNENGKLAPQTLHLKRIALELAAIAVNNCMSRLVVEYLFWRRICCAELILWTSRTGD